ncbi:MAG: thioredoxin domain-containing protein, partial [Candidatus Latescibacterota bacterium]|nr:thioredoxin domain-containing protein [Candidatus Latescibacterota bacterium]
MSSKIALSISTATLVVLALGFGVTDSLESATGTEVPTRGNGKQHHDGIPNSLIYETSPYLLQHAHNPVKWYPWGPDALQLSRDKDRPIFLSIGYSSCYWCHVMDREVFTNPEIAEMMNRWFVNIKVDREERPDLDKIYMTATQVISQSGGWPNSVFLTPDLKPFFAGTYFPPEDSFGRPGFPRVLASLNE